MSILETITNDYGLVGDTDSYKLSHYPQYPKGTTKMFSYVESRGGRFNETVFFQLQYILKEYFSKPVTMNQVENMKKFAKLHGEPFNYNGWKKIVEVYKGRLPVKIRAVKEGTPVPVGNVLCTIESSVDDEEVFWIVSYIETMLLRLWYGTTVATLSREVKKVIYAGLQATSDNPDIEIPFKLHDFGSRGVSSMESAVVGGMAHLVNFLGTDTIVGALGADLAYGVDGVAGFSIPAAEHTTMTMRGKEGETFAFKNMIDQYGGEGKIFAVVSDGYNYWEALKKWGTELKQLVLDSKATLVIRPDSGYPPEVVLKSLEILDMYYGSTKNSKGYKVLNTVRLIQGDGLNYDMIQTIVDAIEANGYSLDNVAFGMGGGLLQMVNRDTQKFAMKCSAAKIDGKWVDVFKDPITDKGKRSKKGRITLYRNRETGEYLSGRVNRAPNPDYIDVLEDVWEDGILIRTQTFEEVRTQAAF